MAVDVETHRRSNYRTNLVRAVLRRLRLAAPACAASGACMRSYSANRALDAFSLRRKALPAVETGRLSSRTTTCGLPSASPSNKYGVIKGTDQIRAEIHGNGRA